VNKLHRWLLRRRGRRLWRRYYRALDEVDCGSALAEYLRPELTGWRREAEDIVVRLAGEEAK
jgi:hypothetical protein